MLDNIKYPLKITTFGYEIIASGVLHISQPEVKFELANLVIKFRFIADSESTRFVAEIINNELIVNLYNFANTLGEGKIEPIEIGNLNNRRLFMSFFLNTIEKNLRQFNYTFMLMEP